MEKLQKRKKIVDRKRFWLSQDKKILSRSDYKCAHCGKKLDLKTKTREHIIPVTKGGTNDMANMCALCKECNTIKRNYVADPRSWYPYLKEECMEEACKYYEDYLKKFDFYTLKSFFKEDMFKYNWIKEYLKNYERVNKLNRVERRRLEIELSKYSKLVLCLDTRDTDLLLEFVEKYAKRYNYKLPKSCRDMVYFVLSNNAVYGVKSGGKIVAVITIGIDAYTSSGKLGIDLCTLYDKYKPVLYGILSKLMDDIESRGKCYIRIRMNEMASEFPGMEKYIKHLNGYKGLKYCVYKDKSNDFVYDEFSEVLKDKYYGIGFKFECTGVKRFFLSGLYNAKRLLFPFKYGRSHSGSIFDIYSGNLRFFENTKEGRQQRFFVNCLISLFGWIVLVFLPLWSILG